jgi:hypothetical protein
MRGIDIGQIRRNFHDSGNFPALKRQIQRARPRIELEQARGNARVAPKGTTGVRHLDSTPTV